MKRIAYLRRSGDSPTLVTMNKNESPILFLSITRLRLRRFRHLPEFLKLTNASAEQARQSDGLVSGATIVDGPLTYLTITLWKNQKAMQHFLGSGAHLRAMPRLRFLCSEAATTHLDWNQNHLPNAQETLMILARHPKFTSLQTPSPQHQSKTLPKKPFLWLQNRIK